MKVDSNYWRSLDDLTGTEEFEKFVQLEFPALAAEGPDPFSRRSFLKLMAASAMMAGLASCRWPEEVIAPFAKQPENRLPGVPVQYATAMELGGVARALLVTSYDGRPIKIEGNPDHPRERGGTDLLAQASILDLYDPARTRTPRHQGEAATWEAFTSYFREHAGQNGAGLRVLFNGSGSPSVADMKDRFRAAFPEARWHEFTPVARDNEREGVLLAFRRPVRTDLRLANARVILSIDSDFMMTHPAAICYSRDFADGRNPGEEMNRLYAVESTFSVTGTNADHRFAVRPSEFGSFCFHLAVELTARGLSLPGEGWNFETAPPLPEDWRYIGPLAEDLLNNKGRAVITAGPRQMPAIHALVHAMNAALEAPGNTLVYRPDPEEHAYEETGSFQELSEDIRAGEVETLLILSGNPVFDAPADEDFPALLKKVPHTVHLGLYENETARLCEWHLPMAHYLECWGDARGWDGTYSVCQPLIAPLYQGKSVPEVLALLTDEEVAKGHGIVRRTFDSLGYGTEERDWRRALRDGFVPGSALREATPDIDGALIAEAVLAGLEASPVAGGAGYELVFTPSHTLYDGRFANNAWLQELPDPVTKVVWDNPALISVQTAEELGLRHGDVVRIETADRGLDVPVYILPGVADRTIVLETGYGHTAGGPVAVETGYETEMLRTAARWHFAGALDVRKSGRKVSVVTTQDHHAIDTKGMKEREERSFDLVREMTVGEYIRSEVAEADSESPSREEIPPLVPSPEVDAPHKWAMTIDLNRCNGCNACVVACQAENNIPVVGKDQVAVGREMHWLRIDRYFRGDPHKPEAVHQPLPCMQCDNAPCEQVCPVAATMQNKDGLNVMVYNRCIGTRYCQNNCPWKVRRFNYFNLNLDVSETEKMQKNPDVTIRSRGVMEKCTYCLQRIERAKIQARNERRPIADGEVEPACAQSCPTKAIIFGDLADSDSRVASIQYKDRRDYATLEHLGNKPRTRYLARVRNLNPELNEAEG